MTDNDRLLRIEQKLDEIKDLISTEKVNTASKFATHAQDIAWMKGTVKILLASIIPIIMTIVSICMRYFKDV